MDINECPKCHDTLCIIQITGQCISCGHIIKPKKPSISVKGQGSMGTPTMLTYKKRIIRHLDQRPYFYETGRFFKKQHSGMTCSMPAYGQFEAYFDITNRLGTNRVDLHRGTIVLEVEEKEVSGWTDDNWPKPMTYTKTEYHYVIKMPDWKIIASNALGYLDVLAKQGLIIDEAAAHFLPWLSGSVAFGGSLFTYDSVSVSDYQLRFYPYTESGVVNFTLMPRW